MGGESVTGSTKTKPPQWWTDAAKYAVGQGKKTAEIGYVPYIGPDIAAFNPQQLDAMQQSQNWSSAFNNPGGAVPQVADSIMPPTDFGNGLKGYSSFPGYQQALGNLAEQYPGLYNYINSFFPHTNQPGAPGTGGGPGPGPGPGTGGGGGGGSGGGGGGGSGGGGGGSGKGKYNGPTTPRPSPNPNWRWDPKTNRWTFPSSTILGYRGGMGQGGMGHSGSNTTGYGDYGGWGEGDWGHLGNLGFGGGFGPDMGGGFGMGSLY